MILRLLLATFLFCGLATSASAGALSELKKQPVSLYDRGMDLLILFNKEIAIDFTNELGRGSENRVRQWLRAAQTDGKLHFSVVVPGMKGAQQVCDEMLKSYAAKLATRVRTPRTFKKNDHDTIVDYLGFAFSGWNTPEDNAADASAARLALGTAIANESVFEIRFGGTPDFKCERALLSPDMAEQTSHEMRVQGMRGRTDEQPPTANSVPESPTPGGADVDFPDE